jgi:hypothetical protein
MPGRDLTLAYDHDLLGKLRSLQAHFARYDFCADARRALGAERVWGSAIIEGVRRSRDKLRAGCSPDERCPERLVRFRTTELQSHGG